MYRILLSPAAGEVTEKKSRFLAELYPVSDEQEAAARIAEVKKRYWDARHHCYGYLLGDRDEIVRFSDDGEPGGTAGRPILDVLTGQRLHYVLAVVTRYFGGTLLGTGGLVRAYGGAVQAALSQGDTALLTEGTQAAVSLDYTDWGRVQYLLSEEKIAVGEVSYGEKILVRLLLPAGREEQILTQIRNASLGRAAVGERIPVRFAAGAEKNIVLPAGAREDGY